MVTRIENVIEHNDITFGAFLDIEGAFARTSFNTIKQVSERHGIEPTVCRGLCAVLEGRNISFTLSGETLGRLWPNCVRREVCCRLCCGACSWTIFFREFTRMDIIQ
jgi:hypothetical protein